MSSGSADSWGAGWGLKSKACRSLITAPDMQSRRPRLPPIHTAAGATLSVTTPPRPRPLHLALRPWLSSVQLPHCLCPSSGRTPPPHQRHSSWRLKFLFFSFRARGNGDESSRKHAFLKKIPTSSLHDWGDMAPTLWPTFVSTVSNSLPSNLVQCPRSPGEITKLNAWTR